MIEGKIRTEMNFAAAHIVHTDESSKCFRLHGHNWKLEIELYGEIQENGMIVDFNDIKKTLDPFDHRTWLPARANCPSIIALVENLAEENFMEVGVPAITCEHMVVHFARILFDAFEQIEWLNLKLWESEKSYATFRKWRGDFNNED